MLRGYGDAQPVAVACASEGHRDGRHAPRVKVLERNPVRVRVLRGHVKLHVRGHVGHFEMGVYLLLPREVYL